MNSKHVRDGFTLTELLVVVCVILILMSILVVGAGGIHTYAIRLRCQHRMEQIWQACLLYSITANGRLPASWDSANSRPWYLTLAESGYLDREDAVGCPSSDLVSTIGTVTEEGETEPEDTEASSIVSKTLDWLVTENNGTGWDTGHERAIVSNAYAVLCFTGAGVDTSHEDYGDTLQIGLQYLMDSQVWEGHTGGMDINKYKGLSHVSSNVNRRSYMQGIYSMALCDAYARLGDIRFTVHGQDRWLSEAAQDAIDYLHAVLIRGGNPAQQLAWGFAYDEGEQAGVDTSASAWCYQAVASALASRITQSGAEIVVDQDFLDRIDWWFENLSVDSANGLYFSMYQRGGYGLLGANLEPHVPLWSNAQSFRCTAMALACRLLLGHEPNASAPIGSKGRNAHEQLLWHTTKQTRTGVTDPNFLMSRIALPVVTTGWESSTLYNDWYCIYAIYYTTIAMAMPPRCPAWTDWAGSTPDSLINAAVKDGDGNFAGYWQGSLAPYHNWSTPIYPTALACMSIEAMTSDALPGSKWYVQSAGVHSYGYNRFIANEDYRGRKPANDTVVLIDYLKSAIDNDTDTPDDIAPRHGGKANVLFADGRVKAMTVDELVDPDTDTIKRGMLTLEPGD